MFDFLAHPIAMYSAAAVLFVGFIWALVGVLHEPGRRSSLAWYLALLFVIGFVVACVLTQRDGLGEIRAMAYALYGAIGVGVPALVFWVLLQALLYGGPPMTRAYRKYDELERQGKKPCIVITLIGPKVISAYPSNTEMSLDWWAEDGKSRVYRTTTTHHLEQAGYYD